MEMKARLQELLEAEFADEGEVAGAVGPPESLPPDAWPAVAHLAHYTFWRRVFLGHVGRLQAGQTPAQPPQDVDAENERHLARDLARPPAEVVADWRSTWREMLELSVASPEAELSRPPEWFEARTLGVAILRNSCTHPRAHLIDFHLQRGRAERAAQMADSYVAMADAFREQDHRFPAGALVYRAVAQQLRGRSDQAVETLRQALALRPVLADFVRGQAPLAGLAGRPDFEELTTPPG